MQTENLTKNAKKIEIVARRKVAQYVQNVDPFLAGAIFGAVGLSFFLGTLSLIL